MICCSTGFFASSACLHAQSQWSPGPPDSSVQPVAFPARVAGNTDDSSTVVSLPPSNEAATQSSQAGHPAPAGRGSEIGKVGIGITLSTLGVGFQAGVSIAPTLNIRGGASFLTYSRTFHYEGLSYKGNLDLRNGDLLLDWFPFHNGFHLSGGALVYNGNNVTATANAPAGQTFSLGSDTFYSGNTNPVTGTGKLQFRKAAPEVRLGFGNLVPRTRHFSFGVEFGVAFMGKPQTKLALAGTACVDAAQTICHDVATDTTIQNDVIAQQNKINDKAKYAQYWPILSIGFGYRF